MFGFVFGIGPIELIILVVLAAVGAAVIWYFMGGDRPDRDQ